MCREATGIGGQLGWEYRIAGKPPETVARIAQTAR